MTQLLYVADPMCSWCWGFAPVLAKVSAELREEISTRLVLGGLAPDSDVPMDEDTMRYVQGAWSAVATRSGAEFNHDFWKLHHPKRSTWPACRAVLAAGDRADAMFKAIQHAYYVDARDPSDRATLVELAVELGLDRDSFDNALDAPETHALLAEEFALRDRLGATGYPSIGLERDGEMRLIASGWNDERSLRSTFEREELLRS